MCSSFAPLTLVQVSGSKYLGLLLGREVLGHLGEAVAFAAAFLVHGKGGFPRLEKAAQQFAVRGRVEYAQLSSFG